jgi:hypothetical protein
MNSIALAEAAHYGRLDAAYQRDLDDDTARQAEIEREVKLLEPESIGMLAIASDEISDALWAYAERRVDKNL